MKLGKFKEIITINSYIIFQTLRELSAHTICNYTEASTAYWNGLDFSNQISDNFCNATYLLSIRKDLFQKVFENTHLWKMGGSSLYFSLFPKFKTAASYSYITKKRSQLSVQALIIWLNKRPRTEVWFRGFRLNFAKKTQSWSAQKGRFTKKSYQI